MERKYYGKQKCSVTLEYNDDDERVGDRYIAVSDYISKNCNDVCESKETEIMNWNEQNTSVVSFYQVSQYKPFVIDKEKQLYGSYIMMERHEASRRGGNGTYTKNISKIILSSYKLNTKQIIQWIDNINEQRLIKINNQFKENQYIIKIFQNLGEETPDVEITKFKSTATFENTYSPFNERVKKSLDFFLNNKDYYEKRGIPYTLGIAAVGVPGGGKTRLIKQIINYTKRHAVYVELGEYFNMHYLERVMHGHIKSDLFIDPSEFIIIFEDIDTFTDKINARVEEARRLIDYEFNNVEDNEENRKKRKGNLDKECNNIRKNSLGQILNMIDGINERTGGMMLVTTNYPEKLDKAFLRAGRCDLFIRCDYYDRSQMHQMFTHFWKNQYIYAEEQIKDEVVKKYTGADLYEIFKTANMDFENIRNKFINIE